LIEGFYRRTSFCLPPLSKLHSRMQPLSLDLSHKEFQL
jgi:hypothetical protein